LKFSESEKSETDQSPEKSGIDSSAKMDSDYSVGQEIRYSDHLQWRANLLVLSTQLN